MRARRSLFSDKPVSKKCGNHTSCVQRTLQGLLKGFENGSPFGRFFSSINVCQPIGRKISIQAVLVCTKRVILCCCRCSSCCWRPCFHRWSCCYYHLCCCYRRLFYTQRSCSGHSCVPDVDGFPLFLLFTAIASVHAIPGVSAEAGNLGLADFATVAGLPLLLDSCCCCPVCFFQSPCC